MGDRHSRSTPKNTKGGDDIQRAPATPSASMSGEPSLPSTPTKPKRRENFQQQTKIPSASHPSSQPSSPSARNRPEWSQNLERPTHTPSGPREQASNRSRPSRGDGSPTKSKPKGERVMPSRRTTGEASASRSRRTHQTSPTPGRGGPGLSHVPSAPLRPGDSFSNYGNEESIPMKKIRGNARVPGTSLGPDDSVSRIAGGAETGLIRDDESGFTGLPAGPVGPDDSVSNQGEQTGELIKLRAFSDGTILPGDSVSNQDPRESSEEDDEVARKRDCCTVL
ncbi:hypothetical protein EJ04DRAFT_584665 [Polyplosphaeria fusca]|uniref:Uncharacterized protein n=1 Tax=Polyplosphaeria fusca TaxID=682080 RepID=A0A9P4V6S4_9PLEO|nr:hypothetical protein EJ04DRAFT_584665 [Polyplosphaeria fusca]